VLSISLLTMAIIIKPIIGEREQVAPNPLVG